MIAALRLLLAFLPAPFQLFVLGVLGVLLVVLVFKLVATVLSAIPFL